MAGAGSAGLGAAVTVRVCCPESIVGRPINNVVPWRYSTDAGAVTAAPVKVVGGAVGVLTNKADCVP